MLLKQIFQLSGYGENFIDLCLKSFSNKFHILKEKVPLAEKSLQLVRPYLGIISLETRTKLHKKSLKGAVNYCKFQVFSKNQSKLKVSFASNVSILQIFTSRYLGLQVSAWIMQLILRMCYTPCCKKC